MSDPSPTRNTQPTETSGTARVFGITAVCIGVAALLAATFILSYTGMHAFAVQAGISERLAHGYPFLIDAMIVIAGTAVILLRGAGLPSKLLAWLTLLLVLAAAAAADAINAAGHRLPGRYTGVIAAIVPWVLVFVGFILLLAILRNARRRMLAAASHRIASLEGGAQPWPSGGGADERLTVRQPGSSGHGPARQSDSGTATAGLGQDSATPSIVPGLDRTAASQAIFAQRVLSVPRQPDQFSAADAVDDDVAIFDSDVAPVDEMELVNGSTLGAGAQPTADGSVAAGETDEAAVEAELLAAELSAAEANAEPADDELADSIEQPEAASQQEAAGQPELADQPELAGQPELADQPELAGQLVTSAPRDEAADREDTAASHGDTAEHREETAASHDDAAELDDATDGHGDTAELDAAADEHGDTAELDDAADEHDDAAADEHGDTAEHVDPADGPNDTAAGHDDPVDDADSAVDPDHADMPVFHRMWKPPTPPAKT